MDYCNLNSEFKAFWKEVEDLDNSKIKERLIEDWYPRYPDLYKATFFFQNEPSERFRESVELFVEYFPKISEQSFQRMDSFEVAFTNIKEKIKLKFPDLDLSRYFVASMPTFGGCDAMATQKGEQFGLIFGFDTISRMESKGFYLFNMDVVISHEIGHLYHLSQIDFNNFDLQGSCITSRLWMEGVAQYFSKIIVPTATSKEIFLDPNLYPKAIENRELIIDEFLSDIEEKRFSQAETNWFSLQSEKAVIPQRAGYYLGLIVIEECLKENDFLDILTWGSDKVHDECLRILRVL